MKKLKNKKIVLVIIFLILISLGMYLTHDNKSFISYIKNLLKYSENDIAYDIGPQLIETNYETDDTVIADYIIDSKYADGTQDATNVIQSALNECSKNNGGTVWLPEGKYLISGNINIPTLCTLRGDYQDPDKVENESLKYGTIIIVDTNAVSKSSINGLFSVNSSAGMIGLTIYYKGQTINNVDPYQPWTIYYADQGSLFTLKNITIINSYKGIGKNWNDSTSATQTHDMLMIENVKGTFIDTGVFLHNSSDVGVVDGLTITPDYWTNANMSILENSVSAPTYDEVIALTSNRNSAGMIITDVEQQQLSNITIEGFKYGIYFPSINYIPPRATGSGSIYNLNILNTQYGIYVERNDTETSMVDSRWGFNIANSYISGSEYSIMNKSRAVDILSEILICYSNVCKNPDNLIDDNYNNGSPNILEKTSENSQMTATFKLYDVTLDGKTYGKVLYNNNLTTGEFKYTNDDDETQDVSKKNVLDKYDAKVDKKTYGKYFKTLDTSSSVKEINDILTEAGNSGGGVVYLKAGLYNITEPLYVPSNVELRGVSSVSVKVAGISQNPNHEDGVPIGTVINVVGNTSAVVLNGDNAGVSGIYFIYEEIIKTLGHVRNRECKIDDGKFKCYYECDSSWSSYEDIYGNEDACTHSHNEEIVFNEMNTNATIISSNTNHAYISNVTIAGAIYGVGFTNVNNYVISNLVTGALYNGIIINGGSNGTIKNCMQNGMIIQVNGLFRFFAGSEDYGDAKLINIFNITTANYNNISLNGAKNVTIKNCFSYGARVFAAASNASSFVAINTGADTLSLESRLKNDYSMYYFDKTGVEATIVNVLRFNGAFHNNNDPNLSNVKFLNVTYLNEFYTFNNSNGEENKSTFYYLVGGINQENIIASSKIYTISDKNISDAEISGISDKTYTGKDIVQSISIANGNISLENDVDYKIAYKNNKNVGTATMIIYGIGEYKGIKSIDFKINKASDTISLKAKKTTYTGSAISANKATSTSGTIISYIYYQSTNCSGKALNSIPIDVGNYSVKATSAGDSNYNSGSVCVTHTITKGTPTITLSDRTVTYTGNSVSKGTVSSKLPNGSKVSLSITTTYYSNNTCTQGSTTTAPINAGTYYAKVASSSTDNLNAATSNCAKIKINKAASVNPTIKAYTGTYDGKSHTITVSGGSGGTINYSTDNSSWSTTVPTRKNVGKTKVYVKIIGDNNHNDTTSINALITIEKASDTVSLKAKKTTYTGDAIISNTASATSSSAITYTYYSSTDCSGTALGSAPTNVGNYSVKATSAGNSNYQSGTTCVTHTITRGTPTITLGNKTVKYTGSGITPGTITSKLPNGTAISLSTTPEYYTNSTCTAGKTKTAPVNVGTYYAKVTSAQTNNLNSATSNCAKITIQEQTTNDLTIEEVLKNLTVNSEKKIITKVNYGTTVSELLNKLVSATGTISNKKNEIKDNNANLSTGDILIINLNGDIYTYTISVFGDVTGEGIVNVADVAKLYNHVRGNKLITDEAQKIAGNLVEDNNLLINDVARLYNNVRNMQ